MRPITLLALTAAASALVSCSRPADRDHIFLACSVVPHEAGDASSYEPLVIYERLTPKTNAVERLERGKWVSVCGKYAICTRSGDAYSVKLSANGKNYGEMRIDLKAGTIQSSDQKGPVLSGTCKPTSDPVKPKDRGWPFGISS
jgi:hypothetical protein